MNHQIKRTKTNKKPKPYKTMKKIIYSFLIICASGFVFTSCSEEEIKPNTEHTVGGGTGQHDKI